MKKELATLAVFAVANVSSAVAQGKDAEPTEIRALVISSGDDRRLVSELAMRGVFVAWDDRSVACTPADVAEVARGKKTGAIVCIDPSRVHVLLLQGARWTETDVLGREEAGAQAIHVAEVVRARLSAPPPAEELDPPNEAPADAKARSNAIVDVSSDPAPTVDRVTPSAKIPFSRAAFGAGLSYVTPVKADPQITSPGLSFAIDLTALPWAYMHNEATWGFEQQLETQNGVATTRLNSISSGLRILASRPDSRLVPTFGGSLGLNWMRVRGVSANVGSVVVPLPDDLVAPFASLDSGLALRLWGPLRLVGETSIGVMTNRMRVSMAEQAGEERPAFGPLFCSFRVRLEVTP